MELPDSIRLALSVSHAEQEKRIQQVYNVVEPRRTFNRELRCNVHGCTVVDVEQSRCVENHNGGTLGVPFCDRSMTDCLSVSSEWSVSLCR